MATGNPTPRGFAKQYEWLQCRLNEGGVCINIWQYMCDKAEFDSDGRCKRAKAFWDAVITAAQAGKLSVPWTAIGKSKVGKASPYQAKEALEVAWDCRAKMPQKYQEYYSNDPKESLQWISDDFCGLDCNGFVGNYVKAVGITYPNEETAPPDFHNSAINSLGKSRSSIAEIQGCDIIVWANGSHIAIIDEIDGDRVTLTQCSGGGLQTNGNRLITQTAKKAGGGASECAKFSIADIPVGGDVFIDYIGITPSGARI